MRDALDNIRLAFVQIKGAQPAADLSGSTGEPARRGVASRRRSHARRRPRRAAAPPARARRPGTEPAGARCTTRHHGTSSVGGRRRIRPHEARPLGIAGARRRRRRTCRPRPGTRAPGSRRRFARLAPVVHVGPGRRSARLVAAELGAARRSVDRRCRRRSSRVPSAISTQWNGNTAPSSRRRLAEPDALVELDDGPARTDARRSVTFNGRSWRSGSRADRSRRRRLSAGIMQVDRPLLDDALDREAAAGELGRPSATSPTAARRARPRSRLGRDVELEQHLAAGLERAVEQRHQLAHRVALVGVGVAGPGWRSTSV